MNTKTQINRPISHFRQRAMSNIG